MNGADRDVNGKITNITSQFDSGGRSRSIIWANLHTHMLKLEQCTTILMETREKKGERHIFLYRYA